MNCKNIKNLILKEITDDLNENEITALNSHLNDCTSCGTYRKEIVASMAELKTLDIPDPGETYWDNSFKSILEKANNNDKRPLFSLEPMLRHLRSKNGYGHRNCRFNYSYGRVYVIKVRQ